MITCLATFERQKRRKKLAQEDFRGQYSCMQASTPLRVEQYLAKGYVDITSYTLKIKELCYALGSINANIDDDEMVQTCPGDLAPRFGMIRLAILVR